MTEDAKSDSFDMDRNVDFNEIFNEITAYYNELHGENSRAAAILAVAKIENELSNIIKRHLPSDIDKKVWKRTFGPGAPIGDLKNRTNLAEAFGAFGPKTRLTIERLAIIRNKFAHKPEIREFSHPEVFRECEILQENPVYKYKLSKSASEEEVRYEFIKTAQTLSEKLG